MKAEEIFNVIMKLTGEVEPVGDTAKDNHRMDNMRVFIEVFDKMHFVIDNVAYRYKDSNFHSEKLIGQLAKKHIDSMGIIE